MLLYVYVHEHAFSNKTSEDTLFLSLHNYLVNP